MPTEADHQRRKGDVARRVAEVLRQARTARGMSQEEVANAARISVFAYGCLERGRGTAGGDANPTLDTVVRVFAVLGIDVYEWNAGVPPLEPPEPPAHGGSN